MELYLMRHGIAEDAGPGQSDPTRRLTAEGIERARSVLGLARQAGVKPDLILSSPYLRAVQTARLAREELSVPEQIIDFPPIAPHGNPADVWNELRAYSQYSSLMLTGHEPLFSQLAAYFLNAPTLQIDVRKASIIRIDFEILGASPRGVLRWMMVPRFTGR
jgi:phosphohistidine phosphatase